MNNFDITVAAEVTGFWGWWVTGALAVGSVLLIATAIFIHRATKGKDDSPFFYGLGGGMMAFIAVMSPLAVNSTLSDVTQATWREARDRALTEAGYTHLIHGDDAVSLTLDGDTALYTVTEQGTTLTYHQITE